MNMQAKVDNDVTPQRDYGVVTAPDTVRLERLLPGPIERVHDVESGAVTCGAALTLPRNPLRARSACIAPVVPPCRLR